MGKSKASQAGKQIRRLRKKRRSQEYHRAVTRTAYNMRLYEARKEQGLGRVRFARTVGISPFLYFLIENGYLKTSKKQAEKISAYLGEDYEPYREGISSYPRELPEKEPGRLACWFFELLGSTPYRLALVLFFIAGLGMIAYGIHGHEEVLSDPADFYPKELHALRSGIQAQGSPSFSLSLNLIRSEISLTEPDKLLIIKTDQQEDAFSEVDFTAYYWLPEGRLTYHRSYRDMAGEDLHASFTDYAAHRSYSAPLILSESGQYETEDIYRGFFPLPDEMIPAGLNELMLSHAGEFDSEMDDLIKDRLGLELDHAALGWEVSKVDSTLSDAAFNYTIILIAGALILLTVFFLMAYAMIYGSRNGVSRSFTTGTNLIRYARRAEPKTDLFVPPFLPETLLSVLGSLLLLYSSTRFARMAVSFSFSQVMDFESAVVFNRNMMQFFYAGMFLLYFLDFDAYMDDKRVLGKIFMYLTLFLALYGVETLFILGLSDLPSDLYNLVSQVHLPNIFGSVCCYFIIIYCLFFTPRYVKSRRGLLLHRLSSLFPVLIIFGSKLIFNGGKRFLGLDLPVEIRYLFNGERTTFSLLCVGYLFGTFFLRLFFEKRYGSDNAAVYFNGNRFLWLKNILTCCLILLITLISHVSKGSALASAFGLEETRNLLILIPLVLFYHPHKGPRNRIVDALTMGIYLFSLGYGYFIGGGILLLGLAMNTLR